jgi:hypothetical protein
MLDITARCRSQQDIQQLDIFAAIAPSQLQVVWDNKCRAAVVELQGTFIPTRQLLTVLHSLP